MQTAGKVYSFKGEINVPCGLSFDSDDIRQLKKWHDNQIMLDNLSRFDSVKQKNLISATLFNLSIYKHSARIL